MRRARGGGGEVEMRATVVLDDNTPMRGLWGGGSKRKHSDLDGEVRVRRRPCRDNTEQTIESLTKAVRAEELAILRELMMTEGSPPLSFCHFM